jgi:hypothetical protein
LNSLILVVALAASNTISVEHHGSLRDALRELAHKGGLNLVATGDLDVPAEVYLKDVSPEDALTSVAKAYDLQLKHEGNLWVIKPGVASPPPVPAIPAIPAIPALPPMPAVAADEDEAEAIRDRAEKLKDEAEAMREKAEEIRDAKREEAEAAKEAAQASIEAAQARSGGNRVLTGNGPITVKSGQRVDSAVSYGGPITVEHDARVEGNVVSFGGDVVLEKNARVDGDAVAFGGRVTKEEGARVGGEEVSFGTSGLGSAVASRAILAATPVEETRKQKESSAVASFFAWFAVLFGLGFLMMMFAPERMRAIEAEMQSAPVKNGFAGLLAVLCSLPLTAFLLITLIGIPVAVAFWFLALFCGLVGLVAVANLLGARVPVAKLRRTQAVALAIGLVVMLLVARIPGVGPLLMTVAVCVSLGAIIRTRLGRGQGLPISTGSFIDSSPVA